jgi:hypothetical protein
MLKQVKYQLPNSDKNFVQSLNSYKLPLDATKPDYYPKTEFQFNNVTIPTVSFIFDNHDEHKIEIKNSTGQTKQSPHEYTPVNIEDFLNRVKDFKLVAVDHTGFNLPWFEGIHPEILKLRDSLKEKCLYHEFPKELADEPWDFILPGTLGEISGKEKIDYQSTRQPKIEIVSFPKSSTPLIQIDIQIEAKYEDLLKLFPESIDGLSMRNLWVYIKNDFGIDICFILNEVQEKDWSHYFEKSRIK